MPQYEMRPFRTAEAEMIAHWAATPQDLWTLDASRDFPLTADQVAAWTFEAHFAFTLRREGDLVAYGEILEDEVEQDVEIQHLLVAPDMRNRGVGEAMLSRLCAFLAASRPYPEVWFRAGRDNAPAIACAHAVGFEDVPGKSGERYLWLKKSLVASPPAPDNGGAG